MALSKKSRKAIWDSENGVRITEPTDSKPYYRIVYFEGGKRRETTSPDQSGALLKLTAIEKRLSVTHGERSLQTVNDMVDAYITLDKGDYSRKSWKSKHTRNTRNILNQRLVAELGEKRCAEITLDDLKQSLSKVTTSSLAEHYASSLSALINWAYRQDWILTEPSKWTKELNMLRDRIKSDKGSSKPRAAGESSKYVSKKEIPTHQDVHALAKAAASEDVSNIWWYELLVNLAAYSGARDGEIFDLDVDSVDPENLIMNIETQRLDDGGTLSRELPKWDTVRQTTFLEVTPMGYPLASELRKRINELKGLNGKGEQIVEVEIPTVQNGQERLLLFPNSLGGWNSNSNFAKRVRIPAQKVAGWKKGKDGKYIWNFHSLRHVFCSHLINELGCAPIDVSIAAGHKNLATTLEMYVGNSAGAIDRLRAASATTVKKSPKKLTSTSKRVKKSPPPMKKRGAK
jgi:integrase